MKPVILADSAADIAPGSSGDLRVLPMQIFFGDEEYLDTVTLSRTDFYRKLIETSTLPTTSQLTPFVFERAFAAAAEEGRPVICITISQKLSGTYQSALMAARDYPRPGVSG